MSPEGQSCGRFVSIKGTNLDNRKHSQENQRRNLWTSLKKKVRNRIHAIGHRPCRGRRPRHRRTCHVFYHVLSPSSPTSLHSNTNGFWQSENENFHDTSLYRLALLSIRSSIQNPYCYRPTTRLPVLGNMSDENLCRLAFLSRKAPSHGREAWNIPER